VISAPRLLVNDNATGTLSSVTEIPFTSVNASQTVATTSFAGFADAGTTVSVTPHISDDNHLNLEFQITLNEFQGSAGTSGVPPPRQTDEIQSQVTIPDGHTLIVGGLNRLSGTHDIDGIPILERIPIVRLATSKQDRSQDRTSLFIFLRPVILRDDKFRDLKYFSERDTVHADIATDYPASVPLLIR
jgi:type II secretory pathway component GspD/PulD (secretin)